MTNDIAYLGYDRSYDRNTVIVQATDQTNISGAKILQIIFQDLGPKMGLMANPSAASQAIQVLFSGRNVGKI